MASLGKICRGDSSFLANNILLDHDEMIKAFGEDGTLLRLSFLVFSRDACNSDSWRKGESQMGHFHVVSL